MNNILAQIREELKTNTDQQIQKSFQRFFKEQVKYYGVKTEVVGKIAKKYWKQVKTLDKQTIFQLCEELYRSDYTEEAFIVSFWLPNYIDHFEPSDLATFKVWIERYINNWAKCDGFCNHTIGDLIQKYPESLNEVKGWAKSKNRWLKRAAAVSLIVPAKKAISCKKPSKYVTCCWAMKMIWCIKVMGGCLRRKAESIKKKFSTTLLKTERSCLEQL
jgi:3-methyladenine DNA glycosylase AlkD